MPSNKELWIEREYQPTTVDPRYKSWQLLAVAIVEQQIEDCKHWMIHLHYQRKNPHPDKKTRENIQIAIGQIEYFRSWFHGEWCKELECLTNMNGEYIFEQLYNIYVIGEEYYEQENHKNPAESTGKGNRRFLGVRKKKTELAGSKRSPGRPRRKDKVS